MKVLTVVVVFAVLLGLLNLFFTFGVVRRLREHARMLADPGEEMAVPLGSKVPSVTATTADGAAVSLPAAGGETLVGFFTPGCGPCSERMPDFVRTAQRRRDGAPVVAVVVGTAEAAAPYVAELRSAAAVVVESPDGPMSTAFQVKGFPAFVTVDRDGTVVSDELRLPEPARS